ncbi:MAG: hypothetical protein N2258_01590 [Brevinematales bacterium]|nr:hypothetical protein [Brevinematales bacterium]
MNNVFYSIDREDNLKFRIKNYNEAKPFASFFPGIAGIMGIPLWCFYVNRGQCISSFGFDSKDGAIMEFQPANKAYRYTPLYGFRTFIKIDGDIYEPFHLTESNNKWKIENEMIFTPYDLELKEINSSLGIETTVKFFTIPNEPIGALARVVEIKNVSSKKVEFDVLDGLPQIMPYGLNDWAMKNMCRTIEAWYTVDNVENNLPFYRLKMTFVDTAEVKPIKAGHFYFSFIEDNKPLPIIIEPDKIFGLSNDFSYPFIFKNKDFKFPERQYSGNRTPSALSYSSVNLKNNESIKIYSLVGKDENLENVKNRFSYLAREEFFKIKEKENEKLIKSLIDKCLVYSNIPAFNSYAKQTFLDNLLRGGFPFSIRSNGKKDVLYLFSRRHGDLERDYNNFKLQPTYFSQGNGAYRDINQNRRNDVFFNPDVGYSNILYFINLIQLDGYNPLVVKGLSYQFDKEKSKILSEWINDGLENVSKLLENKFIPYDIIKLFEENKFSLKKGNLFDFLSFLILNSKKLEEAEHGEGYWTDHWTYNIDLIESFEAVFPDKMKELLYEEKSIYFYDDCEFVLPRKEKYVINYAGQPRQYNAIKKDKEKEKLIKSRDNEPNKVRKNYGKGEVYYTNLISKLLALSVIKLSTLDPENIGIEMEAGKPNWNDSINGLPGLFGSSLNETLELKRLLVNLKNWIKINTKEVKLPIEIYDLMKSVLNLIKENLSRKISNFEFWDLASTEREMYREKVKYGIDGKEIKIEQSELEEFIEFALKKLSHSIEKGFDYNNGLYTTYFYYDLVKYRVENDKIIPEKFEMRRVVPFLEGEVHYLRTEKDISKSRQIALNVKQSDIFDKKLRMYKLSASTKDMPLELGRMQSFTPGWLENESVFSHMEYKYLLELIKNGLCDIFYEDIKTCLVPFFKPEIYGRSIFENVSFIVTSSNPDPDLHGRGFYPRLSGTTSEFYNMLLVMAFGNKPFYLDNEGKLCLKFEPSLASWLFSEKEDIISYYVGEEIKQINLPPNCYLMSFMYDTLVLFINPKRKDTFGENSVKVKSYKLYGKDGSLITIDSDTINMPYSLEIREGKYSKIEVLLD